MIIWPLNTNIDTSKMVNNSRLILSTGGDELSIYLLDNNDKTGLRLDYSKKEKAIYARAINDKATGFNSVKIAQF